MFNVSKYHLLGALSVLSLACEKATAPEEVKGTTPYPFDYPALFRAYLPPIEEPDDNLTTVEGVALGRKLFFDKRLSGDNTQSCASCHLPEQSFSDRTALSTGVDGLAGSRNAMPIVNIGWMRQGLFWDGRSPSAEQQALEPVSDPVELHQSWPEAIEKLRADKDYPKAFKAAFGRPQIDSVTVVKAIAQFERTLISGNAPFDQFLTHHFATGSSGWSEERELLMYQGFSLFMSEDKGDCFHCHGDAFNPLWTDNRFHNNGLDAYAADRGLGAVTGKASDDGKFKTPTLRNLAFTAPYMHDGRFATLDEVLQHYSSGVKKSATIDPLMKKADQGGVQLTPDERNALKWFLLSLSDSSFVSNPSFGSPW